MDTKVIKPEKENQNKEKVRSHVLGLNQIKQRKKAI